MNLFIINTNKQADQRYEQEMIDEKKCAAYRSTKQVIEEIQKGDKVLLYSNDKGIIARGTATGRINKQVDKGETDAEYNMALDDFYQYIKEIDYKLILSIIQKADSSFARPFNVTSLQFGLPVSQKIWDQVNRYV